MMSHSSLFPQSVPSKEGFLFQEETKGLLRIEKALDNNMEVYARKHSVTVSWRKTHQLLGAPETARSQEAVVREH